MRLRLQQNILNRQSSRNDRGCTDDDDDDDDGDDDDGDDDDDVRPTSALAKSSC